MARIVASITVFKRTAIISASEGTPRKRKDCPMPVCRENGGQQVMFFWHLHVLPPIRDLLYLIRNKGTH